MISIRHLFSKTLYTVNSALLLDCVFVPSKYYNNKWTLIKNINIWQHAFIAIFIKLYELSECV